MVGVQEKEQKSEKNVEFGQKWQNRPKLVRTKYIKSEKWSIFGQIFALNHFFPLF